MNIACIIAYDGSKFCGFNKQKNEVIDSDSKKMSVAGFFENRLQKIGIKTNIIGSGRTDKGVHATYQVINFHATLHMPLEKMKKLLNDRLYPFVLIKKIFIVNDSFHARFSANMRFYKYIFTQDEVMPFYNFYIAKVNHGSLESMQIAIKEFMGTHDFSLFKKNGSETKNFIRTITKANIFPAKIHNIGCFVAHIGANGFLRSQVRIMLKACFEFSLDKISLQDLKNQINNKITLHDNACIRELVPACGLYLSRVIYKSEEICKV